MTPLATCPEGIASKAILATSNLRWNWREQRAYEIHDHDLYGRRFDHFRQFRADFYAGFAYLWARTVRCEAPNCGAEVPLLRSFWLCRKPKRKRALRYRVERRQDAPPVAQFEVFAPRTDDEVTVGTVARARATCLCKLASLHLPRRVEHWRAHP